jgi:hemerythrin-like domain-containing protein
MSDMTDLTTILDGIHEDSLSSDELSNPLPLTKDWIRGYLSELDICEGPPRADPGDGPMDMRPLEILLAEHRIVEEVLGGLEATARDFRYLAEPPRKSAGEIVWFLRAFVDGCHHAKEEGILFPLLEGTHMHPNMGPTAAMRMEHRLGAGLIRDMEQGLAAAGEDARRRFAHAAEAYAGLLRTHIRKEDHCVFALAEALLDTREKDRLAEAFLQADLAFAASGEGVDLSRARDLLDRLAEGRGRSSLAGKLPFPSGTPGIRLEPATASISPVEEAG